MRISFWRNIAFGGIVSSFLLSSTCAVTAPTAAVTAPTEGNAYYVAVDGSNANAGTIDKPFATLDYAAGKVAPGDTVFLRGGIYRIDREVKLSKSGTASDRIIYQAYQNEKPILDMSAVVESWTNYADQIYKGTVSEDVFVISDDHILTEATSLEGMTEGTYFQTGQDLYVWCDGGGHPSSHDIGLLMKWSDVYVAAVNISGNFVDFKNITVRNVPGFGIYCEGTTSSRVIGCTTKYIDLNGIYVDSCIDTEVKDSIVHDAVMQNWPRGTGEWASGIGFQSGTDCSAIGNQVYRNNGEGILLYGNATSGGTKDMKVLHNTVYDNWSMNIYLDHASNAFVDSNLVYNTPDAPQSVVAADAFRANPNGIFACEEYTYGKPGDLKNGIITNNVVINSGADFGYWYDTNAPKDITPGLKNFLVANNTFVAANGGCAVSIGYGDHSGTVFENNVLYGASAEGCLIYVPENSHFTYRNNCWYHEENSKPFVTEGSVEKIMSFAEWKTLMGIDSSNIWADPQFTDLANQNVHLKIHSPAIDHGFVYGIRFDCEGNIRPLGAAFDIGAYESRPRHFFELLLGGRFVLDGRIFSDNRFFA